MLLDFPLQPECLQFFFAERPLQFLEQPQHIAQLTLHRKRSLAALLAAGDGHVVEAFSRLRKEERVRA